MVISLAQSMSAQTAVPDHRAPLLHFMGRDGGTWDIFIEGSTANGCLASSQHTS
jgi:hypothetical protein